MKLRCIFSIRKIHIRLWFRNFSELYLKLNLVCFFIKYVWTDKKLNKIFFKSQQFSSLLEPRENSQSPRKLPKDVYSRHVINLISNKIKKIARYRETKRNEVKSRIFLLEMAKEIFADQVRTSNLCRNQIMKVVFFILILVAIVASTVHCYNKDINNNHASDNQGNL